MDLGSRALFAVVLVTGVVGTGLTAAAIDAAGYRILGSVVWGVGYLTTVGVLWYGGLRPLDLVGAATGDR